MKILVTAGPTREPIDPVRFISNRSSGKMGYAVASAALARGHAVALVSGPVALAPPRGAVLTRVETASEMLAAVRRRIAWCDALVMVAAVADWRPLRCSARKIKKSRMPSTLRLVPTPDILAALAPAKRGRIFVGFAAETGALKSEALRKLRTKRLDLIVANRVGRAGTGFESDFNRVAFYSAAGVARQMQLMRKTTVAREIIRWIERKASFKRSA